MILGGIEKVIAWLDLNGIESWCISTSRDRQKCEYIFKSNDDAPIKDEQARMIETLSLSSNNTLYIFGKKKGTGNSANFMEMFSNNQQATTTTPQVVSGVDHTTMDTMIQTAIERERMAWERKELERDREEVRALKKEYEEQKESIFGMLVQKAAPFVQAMMGVQQPNVAIGRLNDSVEPIRAKKQEEAEQTPQQQETTDIAADDIFTDEEAEKIEALVERWKNADADYINVIQRIVEFAESGEPISVMGGMVKLNYSQIKEMIL